MARKKRDESEIIYDPDLFDLLTTRSIQEITGTKTRQAVHNWIYRGWPPEKYAKVIKHLHSFVTKRVA